MSHVPRAYRYQESTKWTSGLVKIRQAVPGEEEREKKPAPGSKLLFGEAQWYLISY